MNSSPLSESRPPKPPGQGSAGTPHIQPPRKDSNSNSKPGAGETRTNSTTKPGQGTRGTGSKNNPSRT